MKSRRNSLEKISFDKNVNLGLWLDKFIEGQDVEKKDGDKFKAQIVSQAAKIRVSEDYEKFFERYLENLDEIKPNIIKAIEIDSRMIIGLGGESVWENSISIHRTYGVPFIPGSALKGLAASYARKFLKDFSEESYDFIFGSQECAGFITFHDALLIPSKTAEKFLHPEIMTVHHPDYYSDKKDKEGNRFPPADWDSPKPINFVSASGKYQLVLTGVEECEDWLNKVVKILAYALKDEGIGAKTSSGYGRAKLADNFHKTKKMREQEDKRKQAEIERQQEDVRLAEEKRQEEKRLAYEAEKQAKETQEQQLEVSRIQRTYEQIQQINANTKKLEKEFERISQTIYKIQDAGQKMPLAKAALEKIEQLQNENIKIDVSRKWYSSLKKMGGVN